MNQPPPGYGTPPPGGYGPGNYPPPGGYGPGGYGPGPGGAPKQSSTPTVLSIIGIVCWFCCSPAAIVLGFVAQSQFRRDGRPDTLAKVAWIGGIVALVIGIIFAATGHLHFHGNTTTTG